MAKEKHYPIDFKYPIPYKEPKELKAKVLFGVHHYYMYKIRKIAENNTEEKNINLKK